MAATTASTDPLKDGSRPSKGSVSLKKDPSTSSSSGSNISATAGSTLRASEKGDLSSKPVNCGTPPWFSPSSGTTGKFMSPRRRTTLFSVPDPRSFMALKSSKYSASFPIFSISSTRFIPFISVTSMGGSLSSKTSI